MANQYTLTNDFAEIAEEKGTLYNKGDSAIELASTADTAKGAGILLLTGERRTFSGTLFARSMDAAGLLNVADFKDGGEGGEDNLSGVPLGTILPYSANAQTPPYGFLFCDQTVSRTMYPDLFALIGTTYGEGDGENTFDLPHIIGKYPQGDTTAGQTKEAGLPNITGYLRTRELSSGTSLFYAGGAFSDTVDGTLAVAQKGTGTGGAHDISLNASLSSSIYGNSDTVTPPTLTVRWIIKAYDAPTPSSAQIDLSQYAADLARRMTREQIPAFNKRDVVTVSGTYTAPVTGWYKITVKGGGGGGAGGDSDVNFGYGGASGGEGGTTIGYEHLDAGDSVSVIIGAGGTGGAGASLGASGGDSTVTVNNNIYTGGGGKTPSTLMLGGIGGTGTIVGASGLSREVSGSSLGIGMSGAGNGGGIAVQTGTPLAATTGGGGAGGTGAKNSTKYSGGDGGDGYAWFEYFDPSLN